MARKTKSELEAIRKKKKATAERVAACRAKKAVSGEVRLSTEIEHKYDAILNLLAKEEGVSKSEIVKALIARALLAGGVVPEIGSIHWVTTCQLTVTVDLGLKQEEIDYLMGGQMSAGSVIEHLINNELVLVTEEYVGEEDSLDRVFTEQDVRDHLLVMTWEDRGYSTTLYEEDIQKRNPWMQAWCKYKHRQEAVRRATQGTRRHIGDTDDLLDWVNEEGQ